MSGQDILNIFFIVIVVRILFLMRKEFNKLGNINYKKLKQYLNEQGFTYKNIKDYICSNSTNSISPYEIAMDIKCYIYSSKTYAKEFSGIAKFITAGVTITNLLGSFGSSKSNYYHLIMGVLTIFICVFGVFILNYLRIISDDEYILRVIEDFQNELKKKKP